jgi:hypothetical protein
MFDYDSWLESPYTDVEDELDCDECENCENECSFHEAEDARESAEQARADQDRGK